MVFELSNVCNLACVMCSGHQSSRIRKHREMLPPLHVPYDAEFVRQIEEFLPHLETARFYGGEPLLNQLNFELLDRMQPSTECWFGTNGTVWNERVAGLFLRHRPKVFVSLDAITPSAVERVRVGADIDDILRNIHSMRPFVSYLAIAMCLMRTTIEEIGPMARFCTMHRLNLHFNQVHQPEQYALPAAPLEELEAAAESMLRVRESLIGLSSENEQRLNDAYSWVLELRERAAS